MRIEVTRNLLEIRENRTTAVSSALNHLGSRKHFLPYATLAHTDDQVRQSIVSNLIRDTDTSVAMNDGEIVGMMALTLSETAGWIDRLYLHEGGP